MDAPAFGWKRASDRLGAWSYYFAAKATLFALGLIDLHLAANLVFAVLLFAMAAPRARAARPWIGVPVAIALLYYDSRLPGLARAISQAGVVSSFSGAYLAELAGRFVSGKAIGAVAVAIAACAAAARYVRIDVLVVAAMAALSIWISPAKPVAEEVAVNAAGANAGPAPPGPEAMVADFFRGEAQRSIAWPRAEGVPFDVIFLHVCSLSWDDLEATGMDKHPLLGRQQADVRRGWR